MNKCYLCNRTNISIIQDTLRWGIKRKVYKCNYCGFVFLDPVDVDLQHFYNDKYRSDYSPVLGKKLTNSELFDINYPYQSKRIDKLNKYWLKKDSKVLDVGCSVGAFLTAVKPLCGETHGVEINKVEADYARGLKHIIYDKIEDIPDGYFDIITMYQVLEHIKDPIEYLHTLKSKLNDFGIIVIEVPNLDDVLLNGFGDNKYKEFWFQNPHLYYFNQYTLQRVMVSAGFRGTVYGMQYYNLSNHIHWLYENRPQTSIHEGWGEVDFIEPYNSDLRYYTLNSWFRNMSEVYKEKLEELKLSSSLLYIGVADEREE